MPNHRCRQRARARAPRPDDRVARVLLRDPYDVLACIALFADDLPAAGEDGPWPDDDLLLLVDPRGYCERMLTAADRNGDLRVLAEVLAEAADDWNLAGVIPVIRQSTPNDDVVRRQAERWWDFIDAVPDRSLCLVDIVFVDPSGWGSVRWTEHDPPSYLLGTT